MIRCETTTISSDRTHDPGIKPAYLRRLFNEKSC